MSAHGTNPTVADMLSAKEAELRAKLLAARARLQHRGNRGDAAEVAVRELLSDHLSRRFDVGQGEIIDTNGTRSRQMDVVVATDDHPFRVPASDPGLYIVEGVYAAGEIKTALTTTELDDVFLKARSVKELQKAHVAGAMVFANSAEHTRWVEGPPPFFAFAYESKIAVDTLLRMLTDDGQPLDALFVLGSGAAINFDDGTGFRRLRAGGPKRRNRLGVDRRRAVAAPVPGVASCSSPRRAPNVAALQLPGRGESDQRGAPCTPRKTTR